MCVCNVSGQQHGVATLKRLSRLVWGCFLALLCCVSGAESDRSVVLAVQNQPRCTGKGRMLAAVDLVH